MGDIQTILHCGNVRHPSNHRPVLIENAPMNPFAPSALHPTSLQFHDSEVSGVEAVNGDVRVSFSAAAVRRSQGATGWEACDGYVQAVALCLHQAAWPGRLNECMGNLSAGELRVDGGLIKSVPLPFQATGHVTLKLAFVNGAALCASGTAVRVSQKGPLPFVENFAC